MNGLGTNWMGIFWGQVGRAVNLYLSQIQHALSTLHESPDISTVEIWNCWHSGQPTDWSSCLRCSQRVMWELEIDILHRVLLKCVKPLRKQLQPVQCLVFSDSQPEQTQTSEEWALGVGAQLCCALLSSPLPQKKNHPALETYGCTVWLWPDYEDTKYLMYEDNNNGMSIQQSYFGGKYRAAK